MIEPATETEPGLPADAQAVKFFAAPLIKLYLDKTMTYRLPVPIAIGMAKNPPASGPRTATNHTAEPL